MAQPNPKSVPRVARAGARLVIAVGWSAAVIGLVVWDGLWTPVALVLSIALLILGSRLDLGNPRRVLEASEGALAPATWEPVMPTHPHWKQEP